MVVHLNDVIELIERKVIGKHQYLYISGAGCAGKTTLTSSIIVKNQDRKINVVATDNFLVDSKLRNNVKLFSTERVTSFCKEAYFMPALDAVHCALMNRDAQWIPNDQNTFSRMETNFDLSIIEGVGAAFLKKCQDAYNIFIDCSEEDELIRRLKRDGANRSISNNQIKADSYDRRKQYYRNILPLKSEYDLVLFSNSDFSLNVIDDKLNYLF